MLSAHNPKKEERTQDPPKYPRENSGLGKCHIPLSENITKSIGMQYCDCQMYVPGTGTGVWYHNSQPTGTPWDPEVPKRTGIGAIISHACPGQYSLQY